MAICKTCLNKLLYWSPFFVSFWFLFVCFVAVENKSYFSPHPFPLTFGSPGSQSSSVCFMLQPFLLAYLALQLGQTEHKDFNGMK